MKKIKAEIEIVLSEDIPQEVSFTKDEFEDMFKKLLIEEIGGAIEANVKTIEVEGITFK